MSNRKIVENEILYFIGRLDDEKGSNVAIYKRLFSEMDDVEFDKFMESLGSGEECLALFRPNLVGSKQSLDNIIQVAEDLGKPLFQHLYLEDTATGLLRKSNAKFFVGVVQVRRQAQTLESKMSVPEHDNTVDQLTGQATGDSKGARISYPELQVNLSKGLDKMLLELVKFRAGDSKSKAAMDKLIYENGDVSLDYIQENLPSKVKATESLSVLLKAMHIQNNL